MRLSQDWITLYTAEANYDLEPVGDDPGNFKDKEGLPGSAEHAE